MLVNCKIEIPNIEGWEGNDIEKTIVCMLYNHGSKASLSESHEELDMTVYPSRYDFTYHISGYVTAKSFYEIFQFVEDFDAVLR